VALLTSFKKNKRKSRKWKICRNSLRRKTHIPYLIILPNDVLKQYWDQIITLSVLFVTIVVPYRVSFIDGPDTDDWKWSLFAIDMLFLIDVVLTFFTAYLNEDREYVVDRWKIIQSYLFGWFIIDFVSWFPINMIIETDSYNSLARVSRIPKIYKVLKIFKLTRIMKIAKEKSKWSQYLNEALSVSIGLERFIFFLLFTLIIIHVSAWAWLFIGKLSDDLRDSWYYK